MIRYITRLFARQVIRRIAIIAVGALFMLLPTLWGGLQANAASDFDATYRTIDTLEVGQNPQHQNCDPQYQDMTLNWYTNIIDSNASGYDITYALSLQNAINGDGRWTVSQVEQVGADKWIDVYWTEDDSLELSWSYGMVTAKSTTSTVRYAQIKHVYQSDCDAYTLTFLDASPQYAWISSRADYAAINGVDVINHFAYVDEDKINYPVDYDGELVRDTPPPEPTPPVTGENYVPDWVVLSANNWRAEIRDKKFHTFDGIFWTCSEDGNSLINGQDGLTPGIKWQMWSNENNLLVDEGVIGAGAVWNYQFDKQEHDREYRLQGKYFCGSDDGEGNVNFGDWGEINFTITSTGVLGEQDFMQDCFKEDFPFIDIPACVNNLAVIVNALSFGKISINGFTATENCRQMQVLGGWINKPGEELCPQFPAYVRNTVTPFVTFILGVFTAIFVVGAMNRRD